MKFTIDRAKWRNGRYGSSQAHHETAGRTELENDEGFRCCLGFVCHQHIEQEPGDLDPEEAKTWQKGHLSPATLEDLAPEFLASEYDGEWEDTHLARMAIEINDKTRHFSDIQREMDLIALFRKHDIEIEFVGEYPE